MRNYAACLTCFLIAMIFFTLAGQLRVNVFSVIGLAGPAFAFAGIVFAILMVRGPDD